MTFINTLDINRFTQFRPEANISYRMPSHNDPVGNATLFDLARASWREDTSLTNLTSLNTGARSFTDFDPFDHIPEGYEHYAERFMYARSENDVESIRQNLDLLIRDREALEEWGWAGLPVRLAMGFTDPVQWLLPGAIGLKAWKTGKALNALRTATDVGLAAIGSTALSETIIQHGDNLKPIEESVLDTLGAGIFAGIMGGSLSMLPKSKTAQLVDALTEDLKLVDIPGFNLVKEPQNLPLENIIERIKLGQEVNVFRGERGSNVGGFEKPVETGKKRVLWATIDKNYANAYAGDKEGGRVTFGTVKVSKPFDPSNEQHIETILDDYFKAAQMEIIPSGYFMEIEEFGRRSPITDPSKITREMARNFILEAEAQTLETDFGINILQNYGFDSLISYQGNTLNIGLFDPVQFQLGKRITDQPNLGMFNLNIHGLDGIQTISPSAMASTGTKFEKTLAKMNFNPELTVLAGKIDVPEARDLFAEIVQPSVLLEKNLDGIESSQAVEIISKRTSDNYYGNLEINIMENFTKLRRRMAGKATKEVKHPVLSSMALDARDLVVNRFTPKSSRPLSWMEFKEAVVKAKRRWEEGIPPSDVPEINDVIKHLDQNVLRPILKGAETQKLIAEGLNTRIRQLADVKIKIGELQTQIKDVQSKNLEAQYNKQIKETVKKISVLNREFKKAIDIEDKLQRQIVRERKKQDIRDAKKEIELLQSKRIANKKELGDLKKQLSIAKRQAGDTADIKFKTFNRIEVLRQETQLKEILVEIRQRELKLKTKSDLSKKQIDTIAKSVDTYIEQIKKKGSKAKIKIDTIPKDVEKKIKPFLSEPKKYKSIPDKIKEAENFTRRYMPQIWNRAAIWQNEGKFKELLYDWQREQILKKTKREGQGLEVSEQRQLEEQVDQFVQDLKGSHDGFTIRETDKVTGKTRFTRIRKIDIPDHMLDRFERYLENDLERIMGSYINSVVADIELSKRFGEGVEGVAMTAQLETISKRYDDLIANEAGSTKRLNNQREKVLKILTAMRDRIRGVHGLPNDPNSMYIRINEGVLIWNTLRALGGVTLSQLPDMARPIMRYGLQHIGKSLVALATNPKQAGMALKEARISAAIIELLRGSRMNNFSEFNGAFLPKSKLEMGLEKLQEGFGYITLMNIFNHITKSFTALATSHYVLDAAEQINKTGTLKRKMDLKTKEMGLSYGDLTQIWDEFSTKGITHNGLRIAQSGDWNNKAIAEKFQNALRIENDRIIVTPGYGQKPLMASTALGKHIFQFRSFGFAAVNSVLLSGLQYKDAAFMTGTLASIALGAMSFNLKRFVAGQEMSYDPDELIFEGFDRSGIAGFLSDVSVMKSRMTGGMGDIRSYFGVEPASRFSAHNTLGMVVGPTLGGAGDVVNTGRTFFDIAQGNDISRSDVNTAVALLPYSRLWYLRQAMIEPFKEASVEYLGAK